MVKKRLISKMGLAAIAFALALFGGSRNVYADTLCRTFPADAGSVVGPLAVSNAFAGSVSLEIVSGASTVGTYQLQKANGEKFFNDGSAMNSEGVTTFTPNAEHYQVLMTIGPGSDTVVKVCLHTN